MDSFLGGVIGAFLVFSLLSITFTIQATNCIKDDKPVKECMIEKGWGFDE